MSPRGKVSANTSIIGLIFLGSATFIGTAMLAWETKSGTDIKKDFRESAKDFSIFNLPRFPFGGDKPSKN
jgi:hypothetical protein